jgi:methionyl-tRNA synthetase
VPTTQPEKQKKRSILITNALTYANYDIHLGHMVGYIQADIWARFQKMRGHTCYYVGGSDAHGTPVMLRAEQEGITPEQYATDIRQKHKSDVHDFLVDMDNFHTTHSDINQALVNEVYKRLKARGDIEKKTIEQAFDPIKNLFLPDRYVKGECPRCGAKDQYGDSCEVCSATYSPIELINPRSVVSGATPITKTSEHYFFKLTHFTDALKQWIASGSLQTQAANKLQEWFEQGLQDWDISRDVPYFGFEIPDAPHKYFYVWMDAPIGYIASFKDFCERHSTIDFASFWNTDSSAELYHFIGKDIMYFHSLFWPAMLMGAHFRTPTSLFIHGFLTINGQKMSKSRGTFVLAQDYLKHLDPEYLRYYFASKTTPLIEDFDLNLDDFQKKVNSDLVGKVVNIASRSAGFIHKYFNRQLSACDSEPDLIQLFMNASESIADAYEKREFASAIREIMMLADRANQYIDEHKPWKLVKDPSQLALAHEVCSIGINLFRLLVLYLKPVLPRLAEKTETFLKIPSLAWKDSKTLLSHHEIAPFEPMMTRIEKAQLDAMMAEGK